MHKRLAKVGRRRRLQYLCSSATLDSDSAWAQVASGCTIDRNSCVQWRPAVAPVVDLHRDNCQRPSGPSHQNEWRVCADVADLFALLVPSYGLSGAAYGVLVTSILSTPIYLSQLRRSVGVTPSVFLGAAARPVVAALAMALLVRWVLPEWTPAMDDDQQAGYRNEDWRAE